MALTSADEGGYLDRVFPVTDAEVAEVQRELDAAELDKAMNIRMAPELHQLCVQAAGRDGLRKSVWAREVLTAVLNSKLSLAEVVLALGRQAAQPEAQVFARGVGGMFGRQVLDPSACVHPRHLRQVFETFEKCPCGKQWPIGSPAGGEMAPGSVE